MAHTAVVTNDNNLWVADFKCSEARNGIVEIIVNNLHSLYEQLDLYDPAENILIIHCIFPETLSRHSNCEYIEYVNISQHSQIYIKFPMYFNSYNISISIQGHSHTIIIQDGTKTIMTKFPKSNPKFIHIPSFLTCDGYKIGECIRIRHPVKGSNMIHGQVSNILADNIYEIDYKISNANEDDCKQINLPISSIYPKAALLTYTLKWETICNGINMNLYFHKYIVCDNTKSIICSIFDFFENDRCFGNGYDTWLVDYGHYDRYYLETLSNFLTRNICDFLFDIEYNYNCDCIINKSHGKLKFDNIRKYYLTQNEWIIANCDCCGSPFNIFDFAYFCDNNQHKHQVCIECVSTTFNSWNELEPLLCKLLDNKLNTDCIKILVHYVIGTIGMKYVEENYNSNSNRYIIKDEFSDDDIDISSEYSQDIDMNIINFDYDKHFVYDTNPKKRWLTIPNICNSGCNNNNKLQLEGPPLKKKRLNNQ